MPNPTSKILAEWAEQWPGAAADVRNVRPDADPVEVLMVFHMADGPRDALKALILSRLDGAEKAKAEAHRIIEVTSERTNRIGSGRMIEQATARKILEALDG